MNSKTMTPRNLRMILSIILSLLVIICIVIFVVGYKMISKQSIDARATATEAHNSEYNIQRLTLTKKQLEQNKDAVQRADQLVSQSKSYIYQDQIITDINKYGAEAGLEITNITFTDQKTTSAAQKPSSTAPAGLKTMSANVTFKNPVPYTNILKFINSLEQSLFKMQVSQIGLSRSADIKTVNLITSDTFNIEVYVR